MLFLIKWPVSKRTMLFVIMCSVSESTRQMFLIKWTMNKYGYCVFLFIAFINIKHKPKALVWNRDSMLVIPAFPVKKPLSSTLAVKVRAAKQNSIV